MVHNDWWISDLIPKKYEKFEFWKNYQYVTKYKSEALVYHIYVYMYIVVAFIVYDSRVSYAYLWGSAWDLICLLYYRRLWQTSADQDIDIWFILNLHVFPRIIYAVGLERTKSRNRGQIQNESYINLHHSTQNFILISNLKSRLYFCVRIQEKTTV